jgi:hypothetical protein
VQTVLVAYFIICICSGIEYYWIFRGENFVDGHGRSGVRAEQSAGMAELVLYGSRRALFQLHFSHDAT